MSTEVRREGRAAQRACGAGWVGPGNAQGAHEMDGVSRTLVIEGWLTSLGSLAGSE